MFFRLIGRVPAPAATSKTRNARLRVGSVSAWRISKEQQIKEPPQTADKLLPHPAARPPRAGRAAGPAVPSLARLRHRPSAATIAIARHHCRCRFRCRDRLAALPPTQWSATAWHNERGNALIRATHLVDGSCLTRLRRVHSRRPQLSKKILVAAERHDVPAAKRAPQHRVRSKRSLGAAGSALHLSCGAKVLRPTCS